MKLVVDLVFIDSVLRSRRETRLELYSASSSTVGNLVVVDVTIDVKALHHPPEHCAEALNRFLSEQAGNYINVKVMVPLH